MGIRFPTVIQHIKLHILRPISLHSNNKSSPAAAANVPKGHFAVYVGESCARNKHRFVVPISYLKHPSFQELLRRAEEEYGFDHPMGELTIPCSQDAFLSVISHLN